MRPGKLRHRIEIQEPTETRSASGQATVTWSTIATVWASVEPLRGREFFASKQIQAQVDTRIRIRYISGLTPKMRILWGTRVYLIDSIINPEERNIELQLMVREIL